MIYYRRNYKVAISVISHHIAQIDNMLDNFHYDYTTMTKLDYIKETAYLKEEIRGYTSMIKSALDALNDQTNKWKEQE